MAQPKTSKEAVRPGVYYTNHSRLAVDRAVGTRLFAACRPL
jgi:hypothetical protein